MFVYSPVLLNSVVEMEQEEEPPVLPVGSGSRSEPEASGGVVNVRVDEAWHVSSMPEEKQYFSQDVSAKQLCFCVRDCIGSHHFPPYTIPCRNPCLRLL